MMTIEEIDRQNIEIWETCSQDARQAMESCRRVLEQAQRADYRYGVACVKRNQGECHWVLLEYMEALSVLFEALHLFRDLGDREQESTVLNTIGKIHFRLNNYQLALDAYNRCLEIRQALRNRSGEAGVLNNIGLVYFDMGRYLDAHEYQTRSLQIHEEIDNPAGIATTLNNLGLVYGKMADMVRSLDCHLKSLDIKNNLGNYSGVCASLNNLGDLHRRSGDLQQALSYNRQSLEIAQRYNYPYYEALAWVNVGEVHQAQEELEQAMHCYDQALQLLNGAGDGFTRADILLNIGDNFVRRGLYEQAFSYLDQALALGENLASEDLISRSHQVLSFIYEARGETARAFSHYKRFHEAQARLFATEFEHLRKLLEIRAEMDRVKSESEIHRLKHVELAQAYRDLQEADQHKETLLHTLRTQTQELERLTREDVLTSVSNRRHLYQLATMEYERARRFRHEFTLAMVDIDNFKQINDRFSHQVGDTVLRIVAQLLRAGCRLIDGVGRYGGEEFMILLPETDLQNSVRLCERLRVAVQDYDWPRIQPGMAITISIGLADLRDADELEKIIALADARLYAAKQRGKNLVCTTV